MAGLIGRLAQDVRADRVRHENQKKDECDLERGQCRPFVDHKADEGQHAAQRLAVAGRMDAAVKIRKPEHPDARADEKDEPADNEKRRCHFPRRGKAEFTHILFPPMNFATMRDPKNPKSA